MARIQVQGIDTVAINPVASPVDSYYRPADPSPSPLHDLADGLAALDSGLSSFMGKRMEKKNNEDKIRAEAAFNQNNALGWEEAVRQGKVPANASPIFMKSYKQSQGNLAGIKLKQQFSGEFNQWGGRNSNDPAAFNGFVQDFIKRNVNTQDVDVLSTLNEHVRSIYDSGYESFQKESNTAIYEGSLNTHGALMGASVDGANTDGLVSGTGTDYESLWGSLLSEREKALRAGTRTEDIDKQMAETIAAKAIEHEDPQLLELLDKVLPGGATKMSDLPDFRDLKQSTIDKLMNAAHERMVFNDARQKKIDKDREDKIVSEIVVGLEKDPSMSIPDDVMNEWAKYDPLARKKVTDLRKAFMEDRGQENPDRINKLLVTLREGGGKEVVYRAFQDGDIKNPNTLKDMLDRADKYQKGRQEGTGILTSQTSQRFLSIIKNRTLDAESPLMRGLDGVPIVGMTDEGLQATTDFEAMLMDWDAKNPDATLIDREKAINEIGNTIIERINPSQDIKGTDPNKYINPTNPTRAEAEQIMRPGGSPTPVPEGRTGDFITKTYGGELPPMLDVLPEEEQKLIEERAKELGITSEEYNMEIWKRTKEILKQGTQSAPQNPPVVEPTPGVDTQQTGSITPASAQDNAFGQAIDTFKVNAESSSGVGVAARGTGQPILDLIGHTEGTDRGRGYNETLGYGAYTGGDVELTKMTIGQVKELQGRMLSHPKNTWNSSALGRYQIVRKTLRKLQAEMGLSDDTLFDEKTQDAMAVQLLKGRGLDAWKSGRMTDAQFMDNLSKEWASFPKSTGGGYYSGQKAAVGPDAVLSAFTALKSQKDDPFGAVLTETSGKKFANIDGKEYVVPAAYGKIPQDEVAQFMQWNSDPIANHDKNLESIDQSLAKVIKRAQEIANFKFVVGSGKRDVELQKKAVQWGWSKKLDSDHLHGGAADMWVLDDDGTVNFKDSSKQKEVARAMKQAAKELGVNIEWGGDWKSFKDMPHFAIKA